MRKLLFLAAGTVLVGGSVCAQTSLGDRDSIELTRLIIQSNRQAIVNTAMDLTEEESQSFWPLYKEWRTEMARIGDRKVELLTQIDEHYRELDDQQAGTLLDDWLKIEADTLKLKQEYVQRFRKILPDKTVARFFQMENKLDATVAYDLVGTLPLIE